MPRVGKRGSSVRDRKVGLIWCSYKAVLGYDVALQMMAGDQKSEGSMVCRLSKKYEAEFLERFEKALRWLWKFICLLL